MCCNGSRKSAPQLHAVASTWSSCVSLPIQRIFFGMCANLGLVIYGGDWTNACAHSPSPNHTYLSVDEAYCEWYYNEYKIKLDWGQKVLPVLHALQGHLESGKQWMWMIDEIFIHQMGFQTTTHSRCVYRQVLSDGFMQLMLRQVDDFLLACDLEQTAWAFFSYNWKEDSIPHWKGKEHHYIWVFGCCKWLQWSWFGSNTWLHQVQLCQLLVLLD